MRSALALVRRRQLRRDSTVAERLLWKHLRAHRFAGVKFRRQHPLGPFVVDFCCVEQAVAIELDGEPHFLGDAQLYDARRTEYLEKQGVRVLRFNNDIVMGQLEDVLEEIARAVGVQI